MIFEQLFEPQSCTYTYFLADQASKEALLIDPVLEEIPTYLSLLERYEVKLALAVDTHLHADHITGLGGLQDTTNCAISMGKYTKAQCLSYIFKEGDYLHFGKQRLKVLYTPGHTNDSYSFLLSDRVFTGDTLLINGTGRTDFQSGDAVQQYDSLFNKLLCLDDEIKVYPAHDYNGKTVSTIKEQKVTNPRLQVKNCDEYVEIMNNLKLSPPNRIDDAIPANVMLGRDAPLISERYTQNKSTSYS